MHVLPKPVTGALTFLMITVNTLILAPPLILLGVLKFALPFKPVFSICDRIVVTIAERWIGNNALISRWMHKCMKKTMKSGRLR